MDRSGELGADDRAELRIELAPGEIALLDRIGAQRVAEVTGRELDLLLDGPLAIQVARADEKRLRPAKRGSGEFSFAYVEEDAIARGLLFAGRHRVPEADPDGLDQHDLHSRFGEHFFQSGQSLIDCRQREDLRVRRRPR